MIDKPQVTPITLSIDEAVKCSGISRSSVYLLLKAGKIEAVKHNDKTLIKYASLCDYISNLPKYEPQSTA